MTRIVAIGMSNTDLVCLSPRLPRAGETVAGTSFDVFAGGKGANQAVAAARAGSLVSFYGAIGDDSNGDARRQDLKTEGIDVGSLQTIPGVASGVAMIIVDEAGENQIVTVAGANALVDPHDAVGSLEMLGYDLALMTWELKPDTCLKILQGLPSEVPVALNVAPFDESVKDIFPDDRLIVICNEIEASQLLERQVTGETALDAAASIRGLGCRAAVITLGDDGAVAVTESRQWEVSPPLVEVVDTTGAGDSFCGAFAAWLAEGSPLEEALRAGVHAGSLATARHGAQPSIPRREDILQSINAASQN